jgi:hypothetical protein
MVTNRRATQEAHERFNVETFLDELNRRHHSSYLVTSEPNPPEAIIQSKRKTSWVEVTSAFMNRSFAEDAWSFATPGEQHRPRPNEVILGPDAQFAANFVATVKKKLEKKSYEPFRDQYGPGYLVVSIQYPLYGRDTLRFMRRAWELTTFSDLGCFRSIYLIVRMFNGYQVTLWRSARNSA